MINSLEGYVPHDTGFDLLDVGGVTELVARRVSDHFGMVPTVLDPAPADARGAASLGIRTEIATLEEWEPDRQFGLILLCRTIEHLYDLRASLEKIRRLLCHGGLFYCDVVDFMHASAYEGAPEATTKIDHCYWLSQETAPAIFAALGFSIVSMNTVSGPSCVGFPLKPSDPIRIDDGFGGTVGGLLKEIRRCEARWGEFGRHPFDLADRLHKAASRAKRRAVRWFLTFRRAPGP